MDVDGGLFLKPSWMVPVIHHSYMIFPVKPPLAGGEIPSLVDMVDDSPQEDVGGRNWSSFSGGGCMV